MKTSFSFIILIGTSLCGFSQTTGMNTKVPITSTTLHIDGNKNNPSIGLLLPANIVDDLVITPNGNVGLGVIPPRDAAAMDFVATNKGVLMPRVNLQSSTDATTINNPATGLVIFHPGNGSLSSGIYTNVGTPITPIWSNGNIISNKEGKQVFKLMAKGSTNQPASILDAGIFQWRVTNSATADHQMVEVRLIAAPTGTVLLDGQILRFVPGNEHPGNHRLEPLYKSFTFNSANYSTWQTVTPLPDGIKSGDAGMIFLRLAGTESLYKLSFHSIRDVYSSLHVQLY